MVQEYTPAPDEHSMNDTFSRTSAQQSSVNAPHEPRKEPPVKPANGAKKWEMLEYIAQQLDCFGKAPLLLDRYELLGPDEREKGGVFSFCRARFSERSRLSLCVRMCMSGGPSRSLASHFYLNATTTCM
jgi:hypothetical protein